MGVSRALVNPFHGTIRITLGSEDADSRLPTAHDLAPWPVDGHVVNIAARALHGMGWTVIHTHQIPRDPDAQFVVDIIPNSPDE